MFLWGYILIILALGWVRIILSKKPKERISNLFMGICFFFVILFLTQLPTMVGPTIVEWNAKIGSYPVLVQIGYNVAVWMFIFFTAASGLISLATHLYGVGSSIISPDEFF